MSDEYNPEREAILIAGLSIEVSNIATKLAKCGLLLSAESLLHNAAILFDLAEDDARDSGSDIAFKKTGFAHSALTAARAEYHMAKKSEEVE